MNNYKHIESNRFNQRSEKILSDFEAYSSDLKIGSEALSPIFRNPYLFYEEKIREFSFEGIDLLDVCSGDGLHSFTGAFKGAKVTVSDIAEKSVELVLQKASKMNVKMEGKVADADCLPFSEDSFHVITCAGSLSYVNPDLFFPAVHKILRDEGVFIAVDSFNYNPFYKLNRYLHFLKGDRTWHVVKRIPDNNTINYLRKYFRDVEVSYFDIFAFLAPLLRIFLSDVRIASILRRLDMKMPFLRKFSFKIVIIAHK